MVLGGWAVVVGWGSRNEHAVLVWAVGGCTAGVFAACIYRFDYRRGHGGAHAMSRRRGRQGVVGATSAVRWLASACAAVTCAFLAMLCGMGVSAGVLAVSRFGWDGVLTRISCFLFCGVCFVLLLVHPSFCCSPFPPPSPLPASFPSVYARLGLTIMGLAVFPLTLSPRSPYVIAAPNS